MDITETTLETEDQVAARKKEEEMRVCNEVLTAEKLVPNV